LVRENRLGGLLELEQLADRGRADSLWQMLVLHGALGDGWRAELLSYEAPTYFGMIVAAFERRRGE
jgi:aromatic ring-opening dioxygenase LigB subunit